MEAENKTPSTKVFWVTLFTLVMVMIAIWFFVKIGPVVAYFVTAGAIAYILNPAVDAMCRWRIPRLRRTMPRSLAIGIMFLVFSGAIALGLAFIIPPVIREFNSLVENMPQYFARVEVLWQQVMGLAKQSQLPVELEKLPAQVAVELQSFIRNAGGTIGGRISGFFSGIAALVIVPILTFYFLQDGAKMKKSFMFYVPAPYKKETEELAGKINAALGGFVRGQLKLCLAMGVLTWLSLAIFARLEYALVFGAIAGVTEFIPYLGPILALIGPLIFATTISWGKVGVVLLLFVAIQLLEGNVMAPKIIGKDVDMHPATIMLALMAGGQVGGIVGMIAAIPVAVVIKVLIEHFYVRKVIMKMDSESAGKD